MLWAAVVLVTCAFEGAGEFGIEGGADKAASPVADGPKGHVSVTTSGSSRVNVTYQHLGESREVMLQTMEADYQRRLAELERKEADLRAKEARVQDMQADAAGQLTAARQEEAHAEAQERRAGEKEAQSERKIHEMQDQAEREIKTEEQQIEQEILQKESNFEKMKKLQEEAFEAERRQYDPVLRNNDGHVMTSNDPVPLPPSPEAILNEEADSDIAMNSMPSGVEQEAAMHKNLKLTKIYADDYNTLEKMLPPLRDTRGGQKEIWEEFYAELLKDASDYWLKGGKSTERPLTGEGLVALERLYEDLKTLEQMMSAEQQASIYLMTAHLTHMGLTVNTVLTNLKKGFEGTRLFYWRELRVALGDMEELDPGTVLAITTAEKNIDQSEQNMKRIVTILRDAQMTGFIRMLEDIVLLSHQKGDAATQQWRDSGIVETPHGFVETQSLGPAPLSTPDLIPADIHINVGVSVTGDVPEVELAPLARRVR